VRRISCLLLLLVGCRYRFEDVPDGSTGDATTCNVTVPIADVAPGRSFTCAARQDGVVLCWGVNTVGQLGSSGPPSVLPRTVPLPAAARAVEAGATNACALLVDDRIFCWGANDLGQLGDGTTTPRTSPVQVLLPSGAAEIAVGKGHACARLGSDGRVLCWGQNTTNEIGDGTTTMRPTPTPVMGLSGTLALAVGHRFSCAILANHTVACWGDNSHGELGTGDMSARTTPNIVTGLSDAQQITSGARFACATHADRTATCWGTNKNGQQGAGDFAEHYTPGLPVVGLTNIASISAGTRHMCATLSDGRAVCWGSGGMFGDGGAQAREAPGPTVPGLSAVRRLTSSYWHACAIEDDGSLYCWGENDDGELGNTLRTIATRPTRVQLPLAATDIAAGDIGTCASRAGGEVACWGVVTGTQASTPATAPITNVTTLGNPSGHMCALDPASNVRCWGQNLYGQLGNGSVIDSPTPVTFATGATAVASDDGVSCAVIGGAVRCAGHNNNGQLGDNTNMDRSTPVNAMGITTALEVTTNGRSTCARLPDDVMCWGLNDHGQLGDSSGTGVQRVPVLVDRTSYGGAPTDISMGHDHACLVAAGRVWCFGLNDSGQLGDGTYTDRGAPVLVQGLTNVTAVAAGSYHTCALRTDQTLWCWGSNYLGELGAGTADSQVPVQVDLPAVARVTAGLGFTCAVTQAGDAYCWGNDKHGEIGDGDVPGSELPQRAVASCSEN
jgi:alpha-tubulin suppressor-like RCC1 family protein